MRDSPNIGKSQEELTERARRMVIRYAEVSRYRLNPKVEIWQSIVMALGRQAAAFGWPFCP